MLSRHTRRRTIRPTKHNGAAHLPSRHIQRLGRRIQNMINRLHREIEGHELNNRPQPGKGRPHRHAGKAMLSNRHIQHPLGAKLIQQPLADLIGALILAHLLAHQEDVRIGPHFHRHGITQRLAHGHAPGRAPILLLSHRHSRRHHLHHLHHRRCHRSRHNRRRHSRGRALAAIQLSNDGIHRHILRPLRHQNAGDHPLIHRLNLHGGLIGLDLGDHIARAHRIALFLQPARQLALGHGRGQRGHQDFGAHQAYTSV